MNRKTLLILPCVFLLSSCSMEWMQSNTTKAILDVIWTLIFKAAIQSFSTDKNVDFGHAMAKGMW